jgi:hypothetical protein
MLESYSEIEAKFVVTGADPESIFRGIADAGSINGYLIELKGSETIEDVYFDTEDELLRLRKWALRLRIIRGQTLITLKGPGASTGTGIISRFEFEKPWSQESFRFVWEMLKSRGVMAVAQMGSGLGAPKDVLSASGFRIVHERTTYRKAFYIISSELTPSQAALIGSRRPPIRIAELDFDETRFLFGNIEALHYEIEIEAAFEAGISTLETVSHSLMKAHPDELIPWNHSKLVTGKAIGELLSKGLLKAPQGRALSLRSDDYAIIARMLEQ